MMAPLRALPQMLRRVAAARRAADRLGLDVVLPPPSAPRVLGRAAASGGAGARPRPDPHRATPREIAQLAMDLYLDGTLSFEDSAMLGFQAELNRRFAPTIGALTGETAAPDAPRDFVALWQRRLAFERQHCPEATAVHERMRRIIAALAALESRAVARTDRTAA